MDQEYINEQEIRSQVEDLRQRFSQTQDLYREVCILLFFRYGVTPTANKLYQLVRKGSMSAPSEALARFWLDLREKSRVRIEHPDLPEDLKQTAGELVAGLWTRAQSLSQESLAVFRQEAHEKVLEAESGQTAAVQRQKEISEELRTAQQAYVEATQQMRAFEQQLAVAAATQVRMNDQLIEEREIHVQLQHAMDTTRSALESSRRDLQDAVQELQSTKRELETTSERLTEEVDQLKDTLTSSEARHQEEKSGLSVELGRAQTRSDRLQEDLESFRVSVASAAEEHHITVSSLQSQNGDLRQSIGVLEGRIQSALSQREELSEEAKNLRSEHSALTREIGAVRVEAEIWKAQTQQLERKLSELSQSVKLQPSGVPAEQPSDEDKPQDHPKHG